MLSSKATLIPRMPSGGTSSHDTERVYVVVFVALTKDGGISGTVRGKQKQE